MSLLTGAAERLGLTLKVLDNPAGWVSQGLNKCIGDASGDLIVRVDCHSRSRPITFDAAPRPPRQRARTMSEGYRSQADELQRSALWQPRWTVPLAELVGHVARRPPDRSKRTQSRSARFDRMSFAGSVHSTSLSAAIRTTSSTCASASAVGESSSTLRSSPCTFPAGDCAPSSGSTLSMDAGRCLSCESTGVFSA